MADPIRQPPDDAQWSAFLYALGELDEASCAEFERRLATDESAAAGLAAAVETILASGAALRNRPVLPAARPYAVGRWAWFNPVAIALGLLIAISGYWWMRQQGQARSGVDAGTLAEVAEQWVDVRVSGADELAYIPASERDDLVLAWMGVEDESEALGLPDWMVIAVADGPPADSQP